MSCQVALACVFMIIGAARGEPGLGQSILVEWNLEAPFPYVHGATRSWPIFRRQLPEGTGIILTARHDDVLLGEGEVLHFSGFRISINQQDHLQVTSGQASPMMSFKLEVTLSRPNGASESQKLEVRPAPPNRPIS